MTVRIQESASRDSGGDARQPADRIRVIVGADEISIGIVTTRKGMQGSGEGIAVFGLYELSDEGTILYSRQRGSDGLNRPTTETLGRDFFYDIVGCDNRDDLRRHFRQFVSGGRSVDAFLFDCLFEREIVRTRISLARAFETDNADHANEIVIMDIRQAVW